MRSDSATMMPPPLCHAACRCIFIVTLFLPRKPHNKRTRWKTTVSAGVNWRFEARQDRYVPATARRFLFPPVARNGLKNWTTSRCLWQRGISILSGFKSFHALLSERYQNEYLSERIVTSLENISNDDRGTLKVAQNIGKIRRKKLMNILL
jgi:hypothetical protein